MQAFIIEVNVTPGKLDEAIAEYRSTILPAVREHEFYVSSELFVNRESNKVVWSGKWESGPGCGGSVLGYFTVQIRKSNFCESPPPVLQEYEIDGELDVKQGPTAQ